MNVLYIKDYEHLRPVSGKQFAATAFYDLLCFAAFGFFAVSALCMGRFILTIIPMVFE